MGRFGVFAICVLACGFCLMVAYFHTMQEAKSQIEEAFFQISFCAIGILGLAFFVVLFGSSNCFQSIWHKLFKSKTPNNVCTGFGLRKSLGR